MRCNSWFQMLVVMMMLAACARQNRTFSSAGSTAAIAQPAAPSPDSKAHTAAARALELLDKAIGNRTLVLLGEIHGTQEIPALVGELVELEARGGKQMILALEVTTREQAIVDRYLMSSGSKADRVALLAGAHWQDAMHDGRDSEAMFVLIEHVRNLRERGGNIAITLFDPGGDARRNQQMAENLRAIARHSPQATLLVLTGNVHAMTSAPPWAMFDRGKRIEPPMTAGRYLSDLHPLSINIDAASGDMWVCMDGECGAHPVFAHGAGSLTTLEYSKPAESAWDATLTLPRFTASPPAIRTAH